MRARAGLLVGALLATACGLTVLGVGGGVADANDAAVLEAGAQTPEPEDPKDVSPSETADASASVDAGADADATVPNTPDASCPATGACERIIFITAAKFTGDLGGIAGGDKICQQTANDAGIVRLRGLKFAAWLGTSTTSVGRLDKRGSFIMPNDAGLATSWGDLLDGTLPVFLNKDESGGTVDISDDDVWSSVSVDGGSTPTSCLDWTTADAGQVGGVGLAARTNAEWTHARTGGCQVPCHLFCIEQ